MMKDSESGSRTLQIAALIFLLLVVVGGKLLKANGLAVRVQGHFLAAYSSVVLLAIPIWFLVSASLIMCEGCSAMGSLASLLLRCWPCRMPCSRLLRSSSAGGF